MSIIPPGLCDDCPDPWTCSNEGCIRRNHFAIDAVNNVIDNVKNFGKKILSLFGSR